MEISQERPPYVVFEVKVLEDRQASIEAGHYVGKDVNFACITPQGSKDRVEIQADDWIKMLAEEANRGRFNPAWLQSIRAMYEAWKQGQELPVDGYPVKNWPVLSPAQVQTFLDIGIRTVEDVAGMNEEAIHRIGMGARNLKQRAQEWLSSADKGKSSEEINALKIKNTELETSNKELREALGAIRKEFEALKASIPKPDPASIKLK